MFLSSWKGFETEFGPIMQSLANRRELLESEKGSATLYEIQKLRQDFSAMHAEQRQQMKQESLRKHRARVSEIGEKLQAPDYQIDQVVSTEGRNGDSSGRWIFLDHNFQAWSSKDKPGHAVLYVNGVPGAGASSSLSVTD